MKQEPAASDSAIEAEKNKWDLLPAIQFVERNISSFRSGVDKIRLRQPSEFARAWAEQVQFPGSENIAGPQVAPTDAKEILMRMPDALIAMSKLEKVSYEYANEVITPVFDDGGKLVSEDWIKRSEFDAKNIGSTLIAVGKTSYHADDLYMSALPSILSHNGEAALMYQYHVLLHEFFHTVEFPLFREGSELAEKVDDPLLEVDGSIFTFKQWWKEFEDLLLSSAGRQEGRVSLYAAVYENDLNRTTERTDPKAFLTAVEEQICEAFVAHQLNIIANGTPGEPGWTNFPEAMPEHWKLMDRLCRAGLVIKNDKMDA